MEDGPERAAGQDRERRRENIDRLLDVLPVTMVTKDGKHQVTAEEVMAMADRTEHAADMAETGDGRRIIHGYAGANGRGRSRNARRTRRLPVWRPERFPRRSS